MDFTEFLEQKCQPDADPNVKRKFRVPFTEETPLVFGEPPENIKKILIMDTETTGFDAKTCDVIELAGVGAKVCADTGRLYSVGALFDWFNEPANPIPAKITQITGITDEMVAGQKINYRELYKWVSKADILVCHNMSFDYPFIMSLPVDWEEIERPCGCSCNDPDWPNYGGGRFKNRKLEGLLDADGFYFDAHRAIYDCLATAFILARYPEAMLDILRNTSQDTYRVSISRNPYGSNEILKDRGYAFRGKAWSKSYTDIDEMTAERKAIVEEMKSYAGNTPNVAIAQLNPYNRFAVGV